MPIELPPQTPPPARQIQKPLEQAPIKATGLRVGETVAALVQRVKPLSAQQRQLLQAVQPMGAELKNLLRAPNLQLAELTIRGQALLTFTDRLLRPGQALQLQLTSATRMALTDGGQQRAAAQQPLIGQNLRTLLPRQAPLQPLFQALDLLAAPGSKAQAWLPAPVRQSLDLVRRHLQTPAALSEPTVLARVSSQSGLGFEYKLNRLRQANSHAGLQENLRHLVGNDLKAGLLEAARGLQTAIKTTPGPLPGTAPFVALSPALAPVDPSGDALLSLIRQLVGPPAAGPGGGDLRNQLHLLLHQQLLASLAKLQLQQLRSLSAPASQHETAQTSQSWHLEIPVRFADGVQTIELRIEREWVEDERKAPAEANKICQWEVMLSFDIPPRGALHAHLKLLDNSVTAKLWAQQQETLEDAQLKLKSLRENLQGSGLEVTDIHCFKGQPPSRDTRLGYSLVDIIT